MIKKIFGSKWTFFAVVSFLVGFFCLFSIGQCYSGNCNLNIVFIPFGVAFTILTIFCLYRLNKEINAAKRGNNDPFILK